MFEDGFRLYKLEVKPFYLSSTLPSENLSPRRVRYTFSMAVTLRDNVLTPHRFSFEDYERMLSVGILTPDDKVELIRGEIVDMAPMGDEHIFSILRFTNRLVKTYGDEALVLPQCPIQLPPNSEPEPDFALLKFPEGRYQKRKPQPEDIFLLIEISNTTLAYDQGTKLSLYAEVGIPEVWIRNLQDDTLEVYREPKRNKYGVHLTFLEGEDVTSLFSDKPFSWT